MKALVFGSLNLDIVYAVDHFVQPGETQSALSQRTNPGGKGLNQAIALARAGAPTCFAGCLGVSGDRLKHTLSENGVDVTWLARVDTAQGSAVIQVTPAGENGILLFEGSNGCISFEQVEQTLDAFDSGDWLILQNEINLLPQIVDAAYERGMHIVLNPSPYNEKLSPVDFRKLDWILVNEVEAAQIARSEAADPKTTQNPRTDAANPKTAQIAPADTADPEAVFHIIHGMYPKASVLITLGREGSMAFQVTESGVETHRQPAVRVQAVDTTAAGDTFTGYFISGLMRNQPLADCMRDAGMASAIAVTRPGAAESIPMRAEVEDAYGKQS